MPKKHAGNAKSYNPKFLRCRGMKSHPWQFVTDQKIVTNRKGEIIEFTRVLICRDCEMPATEKYVRRHSGKGFDRDGDRHIDYEDGYLLEQPEDGSRLDPYEMRDALLEQELMMTLSRQSPNLRAVQ